MSGLSATKTYQGLFRFADNINAKIVIDRLPNNGCIGFTAFLCEHGSEKQFLINSGNRSRSYVGVSGGGQSPDAALEAMAERIRGKCLYLDPGSETERVFQAPHTLLF